MYYNYAMYNLDKSYVRRKKVVRAISLILSYDSQQKGLHVPAKVGRQGAKDEAREHFLLFVFNYKAEGFRGLMETNKKEEKVMNLHDSAILECKDHTLIEVHQELRHSNRTTHIQCKRSQLRRRGQRATSKKRYKPLSVDNNNNNQERGRNDVYHPKKKEFEFGAKGNYLQRLQQQGREGVGVGIRKVISSVKKSNCWILVYLPGLVAFGPTRVLFVLWKMAQFD
uniref:Uncharacterized protein n=1 Tax=Solanum tuberosum TaxID=4113 RepID=M1DU63_SOLTU